MDSRIRRILVSDAEDVLDKITCDVLIVKPHGFQSAVGSHALTAAGRRVA